MQRLKCYRIAIVILSTLTLLGLLWQSVVASGYVGFVDGQVLIIGRNDETNSVLSTFGPTFNILNTTPAPWFQTVPIGPFAEANNVVITLVNINNGWSPPFAADQINITATNQGVNVFAVPNYKTAAAGGSWYIEGVPIVPPTLTTTLTALTDQPAFDQINYTPLPLTGDNTQIAIFDTSPFSNALATFTETVHSLELTVNHEPLLPTGVMTMTDYSEHGIGVASLAHTLAPDAEMSLIRVLNRGGVGDLHALTTGVSDYIDEALAGGSDGVVLNFSLVIHAPVTDTTPLFTVLEGADSLGFVSVAAAGNESIGSPLPPKAPAAYPFTMAVSGANRSDDRACFSHGDEPTPFGDIPMIGAPAGEATTGGGGCVPILTEMVRVWSSEPSERLAWGGTSFAAPLVSGAAALVIDELDAPPAPGMVAEHLYLTARMVADVSLGEGILDLGQAFPPPSGVQVGVVSAETLAIQPIMMLLFLFLIASTIILRIRWQNSTLWH